VPLAAGCQVPLAGGCQVPLAGGCQVPLAGTCANHQKSRAGKRPMAHTNQGHASLLADNMPTTSAGMAPQ